MPPASVVGHLVLMTSSVFLLATAVILARLKKGGWLARHRLIATAGAALGLVGVMTIAIAKYANGWPHLASQHSKVGLLAILLILGAPILGTLLLIRTHRIPPGAQDRRSPGASERNRCHRDGIQHGLLMLAAGACLTVRYP